MKKVLSAFAAAVLLTVAAAGSALAQPNPQPDNQACAHADTHAITQALGTLGCTSHP